MNGNAASDATPAAESSQAESRGSVYGFLAWLFLETPDASFLERMLHADVGSYVASLTASGSCHPMIVAGLEEMRGDLAKQPGLPLDQLQTELGVQEALLFKGIAPGYGPPPPYESVYRRPGAGGDAETLLSIRGFYREAGAALPSDCRERLDHLGMELDFMRFLCEEEGRLWRSHDPEGAARYRRIQRRFLGSHLMAWAPDYCQRILAEPCPLFFHGLAKMVSGFLVGDAALLERWADEAG